MIKYSAPCRVSLYGGGTDVGEYSEKYGGMCVNFAINLRQTIIVGGKQKLLPNDNPEFFKAFTHENVEHIFKEDTESGLGSSAALAVVLESARRFDKWTDNPLSIAEMAFWLEKTKLGLFGGRQDQYASAVGGFNKMEFGIGAVKVTPLPKEWIENLYPYMVLLHSGIKRTNPKLQEGLKTITDDQKGVLDSIKNIAEESLVALEKGDIKEIAKLLNLSWELKKKSNKGVSNGKIDELYDYGLEIGAYGGKILGSGGGGCLFFLVEPDKQKEFIDSMELKHIPFEIDWEGVKTEVV